MWILFLFFFSFSIGAILNLRGFLIDENWELFSRDLMETNMESIIVNTTPPRLAIKIDLPTFNENLHMEGFLNWLDEVKTFFPEEEKQIIN
jgi:hypothetical protein